MSTSVLRQPIGEVARLAPERNAGRTVGILVFLHLAVGLMAPFIMLDRVRGSAGLLENAARMPNQVRAAVLLLFAGSAIAIAVAAAAWPSFRRYSSAMALWLLALAVAAFTLQTVDNAHLLSMLSLSQEYAKAGAAKPELFQALAIVAGSARKWAHYSYLLVAVSWILLLFVLLFRFRLVPRVLAALGVMAAVLQIIGVTLRGMFGYPPQMWMAVPMAPVYGGLALWLIVRGFDERDRGVQIEAHAGQPRQK